MTAAHLRANVAASAVTKLHLVDRWGRVWVVLFFTICTLVIATVAALRGTPIAPPSNLSLALVILAGAVWLYPVGRHAYVERTGITTLRMGQAVHGRIVHAPADVARIAITEGQVLDTITLHTVKGHQIVLTRTLHALGRAPALVAKIESILGR